MPLSPHRSCGQPSSAQTAAPQAGSPSPPPPFVYLRRAELRFAGGRRVLCPGARRAAGGVIPANEGPAWRAPRCYSAEDRRLTAFPDSIGLVRAPGRRARLSGCPRPVVVGGSVRSVLGGRGVVVVGAVSGRAIGRRSANIARNKDAGRCRNRPQREDHGHHAGHEEDPSHLISFRPLPRGHIDSAQAHKRLFNQKLARIAQSSPR
jgi:hypothetical protein